MCILSVPTIPMPKINAKKFDLTSIQPIQYILICVFIYLLDNYQPMDLSTL